MPEMPRDISPESALAFLLDPYPKVVLNRLASLSYDVSSQDLRIDWHDELNRVVAGGNYGFPHYERIGDDGRFIDPIWESGTRTIGPSGLVFYDGDQLPRYRGDLFLCGVNTGALMRLRLARTGQDRVEAAEEVAPRCHLDVANGPDGALYYASMGGQIFRLGR